jgi:CO/xanthine dehydrogenase Mo-binding subunit
MTLLARRLRLDPVDVRQRNYGGPESMPHRPYPAARLEGDR